MKQSKNISQDYLINILNYDSSTGIFRWKTSTNRRIVCGAIAGSVLKGYIKIRINKVDYYAHRLAWLYVYGNMPTSQIDHINGDKSDNRVENLRLATSSQNLANVGLSRKNTSGIKGISWCNKNKKWRLVITHEGKYLHLGYFVDKEKAKSAAIDAYRFYKKEFAWENYA